MQIHLIAVGNRMPAWVETAYQDYAKRLPRECALKLMEIAPGKRGRNADMARILRDEGERMLAAIPRDCHVIALEVGGKSWSTSQLATQLEGWLRSGRDTALLIGGPEGLDQSCRDRADQCWSLSALTLPHPLVRVVLAETLYRAWSMMAGHPYHRE